jgi:amino acid transporter
LSIGAVLLLKRGLRVFAQVQRILFVLTILAVCTMMVLFARPQAEIFGHLNHFVSSIASHLALRYPKGMTLDFPGFLETNIRGYGYLVDPKFSFLATLGVVPIAWTSLQWATYSVEQNEDIEGSHRFSNQLKMLVGSSGAVALILILIGYLEARALGTGFLNACSRTYWARRGSPEVYLFIRNVLQPFPNVLAMASSDSRWASIVIGFGFLANAFQVTCNSFIGVSKIIVRMDGDGLFPTTWRLGECKPKTNAPMRAYWLYLVAALPVIAGYSLIHRWGEYTLGVTFACGYVFMLSAMAALKLSSHPSVVKCLTPLGRIPRAVLKTAACVGSVLAATMVLSYLLVPKLGLTGVLPYFLVAIVIIGCTLWVFLHYPEEGGEGGRAQAHLLATVDRSPADDPRPSE